MPEESPLRILFREMIRENFDLVKEELRKSGIIEAELRAHLLSPPETLKALTVQEAAALTGLSEPTIRRRVVAGLSPVGPDLSPTRIPSDFLERMMKRNEAHAS